MRSRRAGLLLVLVAALGFHARALGNGFAYDDTRFLAQNPAVATLADPLRFFTDPTTQDPAKPADIYRPLRTLSFAAERAVFGGGPAGHHAVSLLLHAANAALLYLLLLRLGVGPAPAAIAAGLFGAHPATVEAVAWIGARADPMAALFTLLAVHAWLRCGGFDRWYALSLGAGLLACLSKEAAVVFPGFLLVADLARPDGGAALAARRWRLLVLPVLLAAGYALLVKGMLEAARGGVLGHLPGWWGGSYAANLGTAARAGAYQALFAAFPFVPSIDWYLPASRSLLEPGAVAAGLLLLAIPGAAAAAVLRGGPGARLAGAGALWALLGGLVTGHLLFPVGIPTAERFLYLPLAGAALAAGAGAARLLAAWPRAGLGLGAAAVAGLGIVAAVRVPAWRSEEALWREGPVGHFSPRAENTRIGERNHRGAGLLDEAIAASVRGDGEASRVLLRRSREELEAAAAAAVALQEWWTRTAGLVVDEALQAKVRQNLARVLYRQGDPDGALREARASLALLPGDARGLGLEAIALLARGEVPRAGWRMEAALRAAKGAPLVPTEDARTVLHAAAAWRFQRGLLGASLRALRASAAAVPDRAANPAVDQARDLGEVLAKRRREVEEALRAAPSDPAAAVEAVKFAGLGDGDLEAARAAWHRHFAAAPESGALRTLWALATMEADDSEDGWKAAEAFHRETLARFPGDPSAEAGLVRCREALR